MSFLELNDFMASKGLPFSGNFVLDGTFKRYCKDGSKKKDEWYVGSFISDIHCWVTFGSWTESGKHQFRSWKDDAEITQEQRVAYKQQVENAEQAKKEFILKTLIEIKDEFPFYPETIDHPYLKKKGIIDPCKVDGNFLKIPVFDSKGNLQTIQRIDPEGNKRFYTGLPATGGRYVFGTLVKDKENLIAEGYATAYSLYKATGKGVVCTFSAGNIPVVAKQLKDDGYLLVNAQDLGDAADEKAKELQKLNILSIKPRFKNPSNGKDFNDLFLQEGKEVVARCFSYPLCAMDVEDLMALDLPPIEWFIDGLIMKGSLNVLWAPPGLGKSTISYAMAQHATMGKEFLQRKIPQRLKVLYIDGEMSKIEIRSKIDIITTAMKLTKEDIPEKGSLKIINFEMWEEIYGKSLDLYSEECRTLLMLHVENFQPDIIFFDNLSSLTGVSDEVGFSNKEESWKMINSWMRVFVKKRMAAVIIHHSNKSGTMYGSNAILRSVVNEIELRPHDNNPEEEMVFELHFNKARHTFGEAKKPKLIYFDHQENNYFKFPFKDSPLMKAEEYIKYFYKKTSHWFSMNLPPKEKKK